MIVREAGSIFGGQRARRKLGGPDMYAVARSALMAGEPEGKRMANNFATYEAVFGALRSLSALRDWTIEHSFTIVSNDYPRQTHGGRKDMKIWLYL
jgi:hypothetical protein